MYKAKSRFLSIRKKRRITALLHKKGIFLLCSFVLFLIGIIIFVKGLFTNAPIVSPLPFPFPFASYPFISAKGNDICTKQLADLLTKKSIQYDAVVASGNNTCRLQLVNGATIIFSSKKDIKQQVSSLQLIYARLTIEGKLFSQLDLRFDKPVVVFR